MAIRQGAVGSGTYKCARGDGVPQSSARYTGGDVDGTKIAGLAGVNTAVSE
jgi:hypothetical protein